MSGKHVKRLSILVGLGVLLTGCGSNDAEVRVYAKRKQMSEIQTAAFTACAKDTRKKKLLFPVKEGNLMMKEVPLDVCACQSKTMMTVFKEKKYGGHTAFVAYMINEKKKKKPRLNKKELVEGLKPMDARAKLEDSLQACVKTYREAHADKDAELFEVVPLTPDPPKKDKKEDKTASAS
ncbi:MAG: hypothetical protein KDK75_20450 [Alphaproteobacteria bacterium]|nr:hypothetical protein [Alphaproteobacteria bacterium]